MRERAKDERERAKHEGETKLSMRERAKHEREKDLERAQHERELSTTACSCGWLHGQRWYDPERSPRS